MTTIVLPAPLVQRPGPPPPGAAGAPDQPPAPSSTMLAVVGRLASHAGEPMSTTVTAPTHTVAVHVPDRQTYAGWCRELDTVVTASSTDALGTVTTATAMLHGWRLDVRLSGAGA